MIRKIGYSIVSFAPEGTGGGAAPSGGTGSSAPSSSPSSPSAAPAADGTGGSTSGASPTPAAAPAASPEPGATPAPQADADPFAGLGDIDFGEDAVELVAQPVNPIEEVKPEAPPAPTPPVEKPAEPKVEAQPKVDTPPQPGVKDQSPLPDPSRPGELATMMEQNFAALVPEVARQLFQLTPEEKEAIESDYVGSLPDLGAKLYIRAQIGMYKAMQSIVPRLIENHLKVTNASRTSEDKFYSKWKDSGLDKAQHGEIVMRYARAYRTANPDATLDQMIEDVGPMVMMAAKIAPKTPAAQTQNAPTPKPFVPAQGGPASPPTMVAAGEWDGLGMPTQDEE